MVFIGGPRQVGKTTLALGILQGDENHPAYLNWDYPEDKRDIMRGRLPSKEPIVILDEVHKYKDYEIKELRARVLPFRIFVSEILRV